MILFQGYYTRKMEGRREFERHLLFDKVACLCYPKHGTKGQYWQAHDYNVGAA